MSRNKLLLAAFVLAVAVAAFITSSQAVAYDDAALVPDCDCTIHNYPSPGDTLHGVRKSGECFADPCATDVEMELE